MEFFGGVEAAGVGEGGGEVVGGFGEMGGEREGGDGDDGVFDCGGGEDSTMEVKKEGWGTSPFFLCELFLVFFLSLSFFSFPPLRFSNKANLFFFQHK